MNYFNSEFNFEQNLFFLFFIINLKMNIFFVFKFSCQRSISSLFEPNLSPIGRVYFYG
ncbi:unnamed protein product [Meloidogyne enterolobii]|uniref:Uncharacterized protein n=1 Tax=Meloidogyne enterolobii TaxID=390850 RepID=A0ACB0ZJZ2_MELEN